jgi:hypothetical protein
MNKQKEQI